MKEFITAIETAEKADGQYQFKVDGREMTAYKATPSQMAVALSTVSRHTSESTKIAGIIDFFVAILDREDAAFLTSRLLDREDSFGLVEVEGILSWLVEEWGGHPTQGRPDSSVSPTPTGPTSTPTTPESTSLLSPSTVS